MNNTFNNNLGASVFGIQLQQVTVGSIHVLSSDGVSTSKFKTYFFIISV